MFRNSSEELSQLTPPKQEESTGKFFGSIATAASQRVPPPPRCQSSSRPRWRWQTLTCRRPALHYRNLLLFLAPTPGHSSFFYWYHDTNCRPNAFKSPERRTREDSVFFVFNSAIRSCDATHVQRWSAFSILLCDALHQQPGVSCVVFRGVDQPLTQVSHLYVKGSTVFFNSLTSTTTEKADSCSSSATATTAGLELSCKS